MKLNFVTCGILALAIIGTVFISGCTQQEMTCNKPYIKVGTDCCLDADGNSICDKDDKTVCRDEQIPYEEQEPYSDKECTYRNYDAKGGYINEDGSWKGQWEIRWALTEPASGFIQKYYITNYEDRMGSFSVRVNFWDAQNQFIESFVYQTISVGPDETEYGYLGNDAIWKNKPGKATSYNVGLDLPQIEECETVTKYRTVTKYKTETVCN